MQWHDKRPAHHEWSHGLRWQEQFICVFLQLRLFEFGCHAFVADSVSLMGEIWLPPSYTQILFYEVSKFTITALTQQPLQCVSDRSILSCAWVHNKIDHKNPLCVCVWEREREREREKEREKKTEWGRQRAKEDFVWSASSAGGGLGVFPLPRTYGVGVLLRRAGRGDGQWSVMALVWRGYGHKQSSWSAGISRSALWVAGLRAGWEREAQVCLQRPRTQNSSMHKTHILYTHIHIYIYIYIYTHTSKTQI